MVSAMKIADTNSGSPVRVRVNRTGRRTFSREYKLEIIQECSVPGASVAAVALSHRINANQVRKWIVQYRAGKLTAATSMLPVTIAPAGPLIAASARALRRMRGCTAGVIDIELASARVRVRGAVDEAALRTILDALAKR
jgi:transposase